MSFVIINIGADYLMTDYSYMCLIFYVALC